jgi:hypothetical protein
MAAESFQISITCEYPLKNDVEWIPRVSEPSLDKETWLCYFEKESEIFLELGSSDTRIKRDRLE